MVLETGAPPHPSATLGSVYVYVEDVDAAYAQALEFGATWVAPPENKPYQERAAGVKDSFGNTWWISTFKAAVAPKRTGAAFPDTFQHAYSS